MKELSLLTPDQKKFLKGNSVVSNPRQIKARLKEKRGRLPDFVKDCFWEIRQLNEFEYDEVTDKTRQELRKALKSDDFSKLISIGRYEDKKEIIENILNTMLFPEAEDCLKQISSESRQLKKKVIEYVHERNSPLKQRVYALLPKSKRASKGGRLRIEDTLAKDNELTSYEFEKYVWPEILKQDSLKPISNKKIKETVSSFLRSEMHKLRKKRKSDYNYLKPKLKKHNKLREFLKENLKKEYFPKNTSNTSIFIGKIPLPKLGDMGILRERKNDFEFTDYGKSLLGELLTEVNP